MDERGVSFVYDGKELAVTKTLDRGWEGIIYRCVTDGRLLMVWLEWRNGGYFERVREISQSELEAFANGGPRQ